MSESPQVTDDRLIQSALQAAGQTRLLRIERQVRHRSAEYFQQLFPQRRALIVADANTFAAAGRDVLDSLRTAGQPSADPLVFDQSHLHAAYEHVETVQASLREGDTIAVAIGSGTINDIVKLASHHLNRPYMVVATAASMDGYSSFGASITRAGSKQTYDCPAPKGILADLEVLEAAPEGMSAAGYGDLVAKIVAGADWLIADALAVEPIDQTAWQMLQVGLRRWIEQPDGVRRGDGAALRSLFCGLAMSGFAMQRTGTSRPASGADHQFSHLWDMLRDRTVLPGPAHGFQVGIGSLASSALYEQLLAQPLDGLNINDLIDRWPDMMTIERDIQQSYDHQFLVAKALEEIQAKWIPRPQLSQQLTRLRQVWPQLRAKLAAQLLPWTELRDRLKTAGCPTDPSEIGLTRLQLRRSFGQAYYIRRRFTVLDLAVRTQQLEPSLERIFSPTGRWPMVTPAT